MGLAGMLATLSKLDTALAGAAAGAGGVCADAGRLAMLLRTLARGSLCVFKAPFILLAGVEALALTKSPRSPAVPQQPSQCWRGLLWKQQRLRCRVNVASHSATHRCSPAKGRWLRCMHVHRRVNKTVCTHMWHVRLCMMHRILSEGKGP